MELLKTSDFIPYKGHGEVQKNVEWLRDVCCLDFDDEINWTFYLNGEVKKGHGYKPLKSLLHYFKLNKEKRRRNFDKERRLVVWMSRLTLLSPLIYVLDDNMIINDITKFREGRYEKMVMDVHNAHFEFRNFDLLCGENLDDLKETYHWKDKTNIETMLAFFDKRTKQGLDGWGQINFTLANNELKLFYRGFSEEALDAMKFESKKRAISLSLSQQIDKASKSGVILHNRSLLEELLYGVRGFDINEAYGSQFIRCNDFPLDKPYKIVGKELSRLVKEGRWFFLVLRSEVKSEIMPRWLNSYHRYSKEEDDGIDEDAYYYFIEQYDYKCLVELGIKIKDIKEECDAKIYALYTCDKTGYLNYDLRAKLVELYNKRVELKKIKDPEEKMIKATFKFLYGKGLALRGHKTNDEIIKRAVYPLSYINQTISFHAMTRNRYEIITMMKRLDLDFVSLDTDGIKTLNPAARRLFSIRNKEIAQENAAAGFPNVKTGLWKYEGRYSRFIQYANKVYVYEKGGEITCKFAGCLESSWKDFFKDKTADEIFAFLLIYGNIPQGIKRKYLVMENGEFKIEKETFTYGINGIDKEEDK